MASIQAWSSSSGQEVGVGEVAVVVRLFLGAHRAGLALVRIVEAGLLVDGAAVLEDGDLAPGLDLDRLRDEAHRVHVLDLAARAEFGRTLRADRDVDVGAEVALLHVAVAGAEVAQDLADLADEFRRFFGPADVGHGDDLHEGDAGAVEIDVGELRIHVVDRLAGVLFEVDVVDADAAGDAGGEIDEHLAGADDRVVELADLVALRQVRVEVVLAVEAREPVDRRLEAEAGADGLLDAVAVDDREHPRHRRVDEGDVGVGLGAEGGRGAGEELGAGGDLGMDLHADHQLPVALRAGDDLRFGLGIGKLGHAVLTPGARNGVSYAPRVGATRGAARDWLKGGQSRHGQARRSARAPGFSPLGRGPWRPSTGELPACGPSVTVGPAVPGPTPRGRRA